MRYLTLALLPILAIAEPLYVSQWPDAIPVSGGVCYRPTPAQCRAAGYELAINKPGPTPAEIAAAKAKADADAAAEWMRAETNRQARVAGMVSEYHATTSNLCALAGAACPTNEMTSAQIDALCSPLLDDTADNAKIRRNTKLLGMALKLEHIARALEREGYYVSR